jgi:hypothetical protein
LDYDIIRECHIKNREIGRPTPISLERRVKRKTQWHKNPKPTKKEVPMAFNRYMAISIKGAYYES